MPVNRVVPLVMPLLGVLAVVATGWAGYRAGEHHAESPILRSGVAWSSGAQASVVSKGVVYDIPLGNGSDWYAGGEEHFGGAPSCLPPSRKVAVNFATVNFSGDGSTNSVVVWVKC